MLGAKTENIAAQLKAIGQIFCQSYVENVDAIDIKTRMRKSAVEAVVDSVPSNGTIKRYKFH